MNTKRKVTVQIEGRNYSVITADDEKYVQNVADEVIAQIKEIITSSHHLDTRDCAILAALNFAMTATRHCATKGVHFKGRQNHSPNKRPQQAVHRVQKPPCRGYQRKHCPYTKIFKT